MGRWLDKQAQAMSVAPVAVSAGDVDGVDEGGGESFGAFHQVLCYHFRYHNNGKYARIATDVKELKHYIYQTVKWT